MIIHKKIFLILSTLALTLGAGCTQTQPVATNVNTNTVDINTTDINATNNNTEIKSVVENKSIVYLANNDNEYTLYLDGKVYKPMINDESSGQTVAHTDQRKYQQRALITVPDNSSIFSYNVSPNQQMVVFVVLTRNMYDFLAVQKSGAVGSNSDLLAVFVYDVKNYNLLSNFTNFDLHAHYMTSSAISDQGFVALELYPCWGCETSSPGTLLWNPIKRTQKNIGQVLDFQWLTDDKYKYKEYITKQCDQEMGMGECHVDPKELDWQQGSMDE